MANNNWDSFSDDDFEDVILDLDDDLDDLDDAADDIQTSADKAKASWDNLAAAAQTAARRTGRPVRKVARTAGEDDDLDISEMREQKRAARKPVRAAEIDDDDDDYEDDDDRRIGRRTPGGNNRLGSYIMIAVVCLLVVALIVLALKLFLKGKGGDGADGSSAPNVTNEAEVQTTAAWNQNSPSDVLSLVNKYYAARAMVNFEELSNLLDPIVSIDQAKVEAEAKVIEGFQEICCYTTPGMNSGEYGVYITFAMKFKNITTPAPGMIWGYVRPDSNGNLRFIDRDTIERLKDEGNAEAVEIRTFMGNAANCDAILSLSDTIKANYWQARETDQTLDDFLNSLNGTATTGADDTTSTEYTTTAEPTTAAPTSAAGEEFTNTDDMMYCTKNSVNIRLQPNTDTDVIGTLDKGDSVHVTGKGSEWYRISTKSGATGYVKKDFLSSDKPN